VGINSSGQVIGSAQNAAGQNRGFRTAPNKPINPSTDDLGATNAFPVGIDDLGRAVGFIGAGDGPGFRTEPNRPINPATDYLPTIDGGNFSATGINKTGDIVGLYTPQGGNYPFSALLKNGGFAAAPQYTVVPITFLGIGGVANLNDSDQVALYVNQQAYLWKNGTLTPIGPANSSWTDCVNNSGHAVGGGDPAYPFLHLRGRTYDLNSLIPPNSGWTLFEATGINATDQIAGYGQINGELHEFRLDPVQ
jgi:probable HAF family extracellular repeat protein